MVLISFKKPGEVYGSPFRLPKQWIFDNYPNALKSFDFTLYFTNSVIYSVGTILITLILGSMFAYCVARMNWKFKSVALSYVALGLIIPAQVTIIPLFMLLRSLHIKDTHLGLILPYSAFALSLCVMMLYAFFRTVPKEMEEAAIMDGCNVYGAFFRIILPIIMPAIATQIVLIFMNTWNEFFMAFILTGQEEFRPLPIGLLNFFVGRGTPEWGMIGAVMVVSSVPTILVYLGFSEKIENALTAGAVLK
ncbi:carbohydrate ABC transporter permease [Cohnella sp. NL03-T5]|nr:carbohydrate ABC transporter permease [Cohnella silvisoli]